jgi:two-component system response regulator YesN
MVRVLIADDEKMIRDGIKAMVNWGELSIQDVDLAQDGLEAYSKASAHQPEIIIADIKMPGLSGLELISKLKAEGSNAHFIVLSGFAEFKFAKKAMMDGVKHYLLKPTSVDEITQVLRQVLNDLDESLRAQHFIDNLKQQFLISMPSIKEQFLRDCVLNRLYSQTEWQHYKELLGIDSHRRVRLVVAQLEGSFEYLEVFALKNIYEYTIPQDMILLSTIMGNKLLFVLGESDEETAVSLAAKAKEAFLVYYKMDVTTFIGTLTTLVHIHTEYKNALEGLGIRFYLGEGSIITSKDVNLGSKTPFENIEYVLQNIVGSVRVGNVQEAAAGIDDFFEQLLASHCDVQEALSYCMEVLVAVSRQVSEAGGSVRLQDLAPVLGMSKLEEIHSFTQQYTAQIATVNHEAHLQRHSECVAGMLRLVEEHYQDQELSLSWISKEKLFMHSDYLGKLFKKETGEYFSQYVMKYRIDKAQLWLKEDPDMKVYELAEKTGFGLNSQYFIKVFKKLTGRTPKEYKQGNEGGAL